MKTKNPRPNECTSCGELTYNAVWVLGDPLAMSPVPITAEHPYCQACGEKAKNPKGTPKSLREAIENGLADSVGEGYAASVERHVRDFIAQRFSVALMRYEFAGEGLSKVYEEITGKKVGEKVIL
jgi:hypothetical protein